MSYQPGEELDSAMKFALELVQNIWNARQAIDESYSDERIDPLDIMSLVVASVDDLQAIVWTARQRIEARA